MLSLLKDLDQDKCAATVEPSPDDVHVQSLFAKESQHFSFQGGLGDQIVMSVSTGAH